MLLIMSPQHRWSKKWHFSTLILVGIDGESLNGFKRTKPQNGDRICPVFDLGSIVSHIMAGLVPKEWL